MDIITEDAKYAFLLGSALRNEDPEQLFVVYDSLIPEDVSESRLDQIKEEARHISELPDPEFSALVLNARSYSLALGHSSMNHARVQSPVPSDTETNDCVTSPLNKNEPILNHMVDGLTDPSSCNSAASSEFYKTHTSLPDSLCFKIDLGLAGALPDDDSGLPNSVCKASSSLKNSRSCSDSTYGDSEEDRPGSFDYMPSQSHVRIIHSFNPSYDEEVRVDSGTDGSSVESPRSETSVTHDEYNLADEGTEMATISYKEMPQPFDRERKHSDDCWDYTRGGSYPSDDNVDDDYQDSLKGSRSTSSYVSPFPRDAPIQVDEGISYGLKQTNGFGSGQPTRAVSQIPYSQYRDQYKSDESKDKQCSQLEDDSDKPEVSSLVDINGNPKPVDTAKDSQMPQLPQGKSDNTPASGNQASYTPGTISQSYSSSSADSNTLDRKKERKRMKLQRQKWTSAEAYEDHKEFNDIKEILDFVEGPHSTSKSDGKPAKRKQERSRKKEHNLNGPLAVEELAGGEDGPELMETVVVTIKPGSEAMGNSSGKSQSENISRAESTEDNFDKNSEFHDCLNTLPTELVISDKVESVSQSEKSDNTINSSLSLESERNDLSLKGHSNTENNLTDNDKVISKKSKVKNRKDKQELIKDNGTSSPTAIMVKPKESLAMKDSLLLKSLSPKDNRSFHYSTDTEVPAEVKREESFTEVKKRKKRPIGKDLITTFTNHATSLSYHSPNINGHTHNSHPRPRPFTPPLIFPAATVVSHVSSLPLREQTRSTRDLSPSAFPVLPGHSSLTAHPDNRRNSCGDISTDSVDNKIYDSDRESAKSLPDARGARGGGDTSPVYPISYARIAAAPPRNDTNTNSPSSESGVTSGSQNSSVDSSVTHTPGSSIDIMSPQSPSKTAIVSDRKTTVWKGSPRERRHSIGSSPEDKEEKDKASVAQRNRQCGSQEVLSRDIVNSAKAASNDTASSLPVKVVLNGQSSNGLKLDAELQEGMQQPAGKLVLNKPKSTILSAQTGTKSSAQNLSRPASLEYATSNNINYQAQANIINVPSKLTIPTDSAKIKETIKSVLNTSNNTIAERNKNKKEISPSDMTANNVLTVSAENGSVKTTNSKHKVVPTSRVAQKISGSSNNTKSVIFLDKRFGASSPQNLGITFGFDLSYEPTSEPVGQHPNQQPALSSQLQLGMVASSSSSSLSSCSVGSPVSLSAQSHFPITHPYIPPAAETSVVQPEQPPISSSQPSDNNSPLPKVTHIHSLCNGLILPSSPAGHSDISLESATNSISVPNDSNNTSLTSSNRTNLSTPNNQSAQVIHSNNASPPALSGLTNSSPDTLANSSPALSSPALPNKTAQRIPNVTIPLGITFSPNHPPPPIPQGANALTGNKTSSSITEDRTNTVNSALPLAQDKQEPKIDNLTCPALIEPAKSGPSANPAPSIKTDAQNIVDPASSTATVLAILPPETETALQKQQPSLQAPAEIVHVIYGEKIKPVTGCGKLFFKHHIISQNNKGNAADLATFLKKKWLDDVAMRKGSCALVTLTED